VREEADVKRELKVLQVSTALVASFLVPLLSWLCQGKVNELEKKLKDTKSQPKKKKKENRSVMISDEILDLTI
jgi:hypothetical protein